MFHDNEKYISCCLQRIHVQNNMHATWELVDQH